MGNGGHRNRNEHLKFNVVAENQNRMSIAAMFLCFCATFQLFRRSQFLVPKFETGLSLTGGAVEFATQTRGHQFNLPIGLNLYFILWLRKILNRGFYFQICA